MTLMAKRLMKAQRLTDPVKRTDADEERRATRFGYLISAIGFLAVAACGLYKLMHPELWLALKP